MFDWKAFFNDFAEKYYSVPRLDTKEHIYALQNYLLEKGMLVEDVDYAIKTLLGEELPRPKNTWNEREIHFEEEKARKTDKVYQSSWPDGKAPEGAKVMTGTKGGKYYIGDPDTGEPADDDSTTKKDKKGGKVSKKKLVKSDNDSADKALNYTKTQAKEDEVEGPKNVGLGTDVSRAGEAAVHKGLRLIKEGKSLEQVQKYLMGIANTKDTYLTKAWVNSAISSLKSIDQHIGFNNIEDISWDTKAGRKSIGVDVDIKTSSDMFVRTIEGKNVGISLKASGKVFLNNGGWPKQVKLLLAGLEDTMPPQEHKDLSEAMSFETFRDDRKKHFQDVCNELQPEDIRRMYKKLMSEPQEIRDKEFSSKKYKKKYFKALEDAERLIKDGRDGNFEKKAGEIGYDIGGGLRMKALGKLLKMYDKEKYDHLRKIDGGLTRRAFEVLNASDAAKNGMNKHILKSMHVLDTLGLNEKLKKGGVDGFITVYGIEPDGAVLNEENLTSLFGSKFQQLLSEQLKEVRDGTKETKDLQDFMAAQIEIDYESGQILIKHENEDKIPLFYLDGRSKAIGASPSMELGQTPLMALALKIGTFDTSTWTDEQRAKLKKELEKAKKK